MRRPFHQSGATTWSSDCIKRSMICGWFVLALSLLVLPPARAASGASSINVEGGGGGVRSTAWVLAPHGLQPCDAYTRRFGTATFPMPPRLGVGDGAVDVDWRFLRTPPLLVRPVPRSHGGEEVSPARGGSALMGLWEDAYGNAWCGGQCVTSQACCRVIVDPSTPADTAKRPRPPRPRPGP
jgi:hypothetical protein